MSEPAAKRRRARRYLSRWMAPGVMAAGVAAGVPAGMLAGLLAGLAGGGMVAGITPVLAAPAVPGSSPGGTGSWCRLDDPGRVEAERLRQGLGRSEADKIPCPAPAAAADLPEELTLPLPCGRFMLFRRVTIPAEHLLDHKEIYLGTPPAAGSSPEDEARVQTQSGPRVDHIAGSFTKATSAGTFERSYYIGKYEVTALQYALLALEAFNPDGSEALPDSPACQAAAQAATEVRGTAVAPATGISWLDAVRFAGAYSEWLIATDRQAIEHGRAPSLPWEDGASGYFRLPTEAEWEYAARGADAGSATQSRRVYTVRGDDGQERPGTLEEIAALATPAAPPPDNALVFPVGRRRPNVLGLHDMIGNVDEIALGLFNPVRPDQVAGQTGGFVVRGGNAQEVEANLGVGARREVPFFDARGAVRGALTGFRLVVSAPVFMNQRGKTYQELAGNAPRQHLMEQAVARLRQAPEGVGREALQGEIEALRQASQSQELDKTRLNQQVERIQQALARSNAELNERNRQVQRQQLTSVLMMIYSIDNLRRRLDVMNNGIKTLNDTLNDPKNAPTGPLRDELIRRLDHAQAIRAEEQQTNKKNFLYYVELVRFFETLPQEDMDRAWRDVDDEFSRKGLSWFAKARPLAARHLTEIRTRSIPVTDRRLDAWRTQIETEMREIPRKTP